MKNHYEALGVGRQAAADEIKHQFRQAIARYHPDKVQHLGLEFQRLAETRAAELTAAYRVLSDPVRRAEYDALLAAQDAEGGFGPAVPRPGAPPGNSACEAPAIEREPAPQPSTQRDRASGGEFVRRAAIERLASAIDQEARAFEPRPMAGFEIARVSKSGFLRRRAEQWVLGRFVEGLDAASIVETVRMTARLALPPDAEVVLFVVGGHERPRRELVDAIAEARGRIEARSTRLTPVAVDLRDWGAALPADAPPLARAVIERLRR